MTSLQTQSYTIVILSREKLCLTCTVGCAPKPRCPRKPQWWPWVSRARWAQTPPSSSTGWCHPASVTAARRRAAGRRRSGTYCGTTTHKCGQSTSWTHLSNLLDSCQDHETGLTETQNKSIREALNVRERQSLVKLACRVSCTTFQDKVLNGFMSVSVLKPFPSLLNVAKLKAAKLC